MGLFNELWSMKDGVSQCWWLSRACVLDWDAAAAIGTVSGVLLALFAPAIHRWRTKKRANALFALSYYYDLARADARIDIIDTAYPLGAGREDSWIVEANLMANAQQREEFGEIVGSVKTLAKREIDLGKWPAAVDLKLAESVATAIQAAVRLAHAIEAGSNGTSKKTAWEAYWTNFRHDIEFARLRVGVALDLCRKAAPDATAPLPDERD